MNEYEKCETSENVQFDETQIHAWIHPDGWFEMNIKAKDGEELHAMILNMKTVIDPLSF